MTRKFSSEFTLIFRIKILKQSCAITIVSTAPIMKSHSVVFIRSSDIIKTRYNYFKWMPK